MIIIFRSILVYDAHGVAVSLLFLVVQ